MTDDVQKTPEELAAEAAAAAQSAAQTAGPEGQPTVEPAPEAPETPEEAAAEFEEEPVRVHNPNALRGVPTGPDHTRHSGHTVLNRA